MDRLNQTDLATFFLHPIGIPFIPILNIIMMVIRFGLLNAEEKFYCRANLILMCIREHVLSDMKMKN
jgi:hypothetical protein